MDSNFDYSSLNCLCIKNGTHQKNSGIRTESKARDTYILYYIISGKGKVTVGDIEFSLSKGQSFLAYPFTRVVAEPDRDDPWEYKWVEFRGLEAAWIVGQTAFQKTSAVVDEIPIEGFDKMFDAVHICSANSYDQCRANANLLLLLSFYLEYYPRRTAKINQYAVIAKGFIDKNYMNPECNVKRVAEYVKLDRTYLFRVFKEETGCSVIEYINNCRISRAVIMLSDSTLTVKDIAFSVGFTDQLYFSKVFKKRRGITPTEYRKLYAARTAEN